MITLANIPARYEVTPGNFIEQYDSEPYMVLIAGSLFNKPAAKFDHPNMAGKFNKVLEFKHYRQFGGKFWTAHAGVDMLFVIPKTKIQLNVEKHTGCSYVPVIVNGLEFHLNVSGGGGSKPGWTDFFGKTVHTHCSWTIANLKKLAQVAWTMQECKDNGVTFQERSFEDEHAVNQFMKLACKALYQGKIKPGHKLCLNDGCSFYGVDGTGPFTIRDKINSRRHYYMVLLKENSTASGKVEYKDVDWQRTALANGFAMPSPVSINRVCPEQVAA